MSNITMVVLLAFLVFWLYTVYSVYTGDFEDKKAKVFWRVGIVFVPFLAFFYIFMKKNLLK